MQFLKGFQFLMQRISSLKHDILCFPIMSTLKVTRPEVPSVSTVDVVELPPADPSVDSTGYLLMLGILVGVYCGYYRGTYLC